MGALMILAIIMTTVLLIDQYKVERDNLIDIKTATKIAARSAALSIDEPLTAQRGVIVIDETEAEAKGEQYFLSNLNRFREANQSNIDVFVINDAPGTHMLHDYAHYFNANGVAVGYHYDGDFIVSVVEVED